MVDPKIPLVSFAAETRADLKPSAAIIARGPRQDDGSIDAAFVLVGKDGLVPPDVMRVPHIRVTGAGDLPG